MHAHNEPNGFKNKKNFIFIAYVYTTCVCTQASSKAYDDSEYIDYHFEHILMWPRARPSVATCSSCRDASPLYKCSSDTMSTIVRTTAIWSRLWVYGRRRQREKKTKKFFVDFFSTENSASKKGSFHLQFQRIKWQKAVDIKAFFRRLVAFIRASELVSVALCKIIINEMCVEI